MESQPRCFADFFNIQPMIIQDGEKRWKKLRLNDANCILTGIFNPHWDSVFICGF